jgi:hypothetical protein
VTRSASDVLKACKPKMRLTGRITRATKSEAFSWEQPDARPPHAGWYDHAQGLLGRQTHASRLTMAPDEYAAWQKSLNQSPSAQKAQEQLLDVVASGCHLGQELRLRLLRARHSQNWKPPPRALAHVWRSNGMEGFLAKMQP